MKVRFLPDSPNLKKTKDMEETFTITVVAPIECTSEQLREWVEYCVGYRGGVSIENPLHEYEINASQVD